VEVKKPTTILTLQNCKRVIYAAGAVILLITVLGYGSSSANRRRLPLTTTKASEAQIEAARIKREECEQHFRDANDFHQQGWYAPAIANYKLGLKGSAYDGNALLNLPICMEKEKNSFGKPKNSFGKIKKQYETSLKRFSEKESLGRLGLFSDKEDGSRMAKTHCNYADFLDDNGKIILADVHYKEALKRNPEYENGYCQYAVFLRNQQRLDEALVQMLKAQELNEALVQMLKAQEHDCKKFDDFAVKTNEAAKQRVVILRSVAMLRKEINSLLLKC